MSRFYQTSPPHSMFPTFLLPSIPFRRRRNPSTDSTESNNSAASAVSSSSTAATSIAPSEPASYPTQPKFLRGHTSHLRCARCATDLCLTSQIISKGFTGRHGRAYLVSGSNTVTTSRSAANPPTAGISSLPNTYTHNAVPRQLVTGAHTVSDISCTFCGSVLGWKYVNAEEESQKYKVGKFILETKRVRGVSCWENDENEDASDVIAALPFDVTGDLPLPPERLPIGAEEGLDKIEFDSEDEEECEDLFAGVWSQALAAKRRRGRTNFAGKESSSSTGPRARSE
ncbi:MAG: hypothetical protein Q9160_008690 [Pyrenula sp. 1 TL-2023]